jgi:hypothetical protein
MVDSQIRFGVSPGIRCVFGANSANDLAVIPLQQPERSSTRRRVLFEELELFIDDREKRFDIKSAEVEAASVGSLTLDAPDLVEAHRVVLDQVVPFDGAYVGGEWLEGYEGFEVFEEVCFRARIDEIHENGGLDGQPVLSKSEQLTASVAGFQNIYIVGISFVESRPLRAMRTASAFSMGKSRSAISTLPLLVKGAVW